MKENNLKEYKENTFEKNYEGNLASFEISALDLEKITRLSEFWNNPQNKFTFPWLE